MLRENFPRANASTKQCVVEYISDNRLVEESNITTLLQTHHITKHQNMALLCVQYIMTNISARIHHVIWEELQADTCRDVILLVGFTSIIYRVTAHRDQRYSSEDRLYFRQVFGKVS